MEAFDDSNCHSLSDSFSLYERYLRTFNVVDTFLEENHNIDITNPGDSKVSSISPGKPPLAVSSIDLSTPRDILSKYIGPSDNTLSSYCEKGIEVNALDKKSAINDKDLCYKVNSPCNVIDVSSLNENSSVTEESSFTEKSEPIDVPVSSEDSKSESCIRPKPVIITSLITMENSNNAVDSVPLFRDVRPTESVFKLPIRELSFNGTLKHVQKLKPIVDPISALTSANTALNNELDRHDNITSDLKTGNSDNSLTFEHKEVSNHKISDNSDERSIVDVNRLEDATQSTGDSQYEEFKPRNDNQSSYHEERSNMKWNTDQSCSSIEASFDSGVRSPDMFSDDDYAPEVAEPEDFWYFIKDYESHDKRRVRKLEETLRGVLPPPSVTTLKIDVTEMLKKYYCYLPGFTDEANISNPETNSRTPKKRLSFIKVPEEVDLKHTLQETVENKNLDTNDMSMSKRLSNSKDAKSDLDMNTSSNESVILKMATEIEAKETSWPEIMKCRFYDIHYNITKYSERVEMLAMKCGERYVGAETDSSVTVYSGGLKSPSSASKRKALRLKMAQAKSPGRRLSHLARRRQAFFSAATIGEKAQTTSKMVLIDKNFFPHRKLISTAERKSPRRRNPGKRTPGWKTPGKKTPAKTPKTRSGGSSKKKAMRRLLMDPDTLTRSQPSRESSKRALFVSPDNRKAVPLPASSSVPHQTLKTRRALFGSPVRAETKSLDGSKSDQFLKRKRDALDDTVEESRCKIAKSLSFGGDTISSLKSTYSLSRRASEVIAGRSNMVELDEHHRKKLLWAVSEALRAYGWRMQSAGFREKASALAKLTRRLLALPPHAARLATPGLSTSETMLKIARQYVFAIIQGRTVEECFQEEKTRLASEPIQKVTGYISASAYHQIKPKPQPTCTFISSQIKENNCEGVKTEQSRSTSKNILQDKMTNIDANSNSSSGLSLLEKPGPYKSNSLPSFEEAAKMRARRQISFDNIDFPKR